jgi:hypothetical protein
MGYDFQELLSQSLLDLSDYKVNRAKNEDKSWCAQFSISTNDEQRIYSSIPFGTKSRMDVSGRIIRQCPLF